MVRLAHLVPDQELMTTSLLLQCNARKRDFSAMQGKEIAVQCKEKILRCKGQGLILVDFLGQELIFSRSHLAACSYREIGCGQSRNLFLYALFIRLIIAIIIINIWLQSGQ